MSEEQGKTKRWHKKFFDENEEIGFYVWAVLTIVFVAAIITFVATGACDRKTNEKSISYLTTHDELKNALAQYATDHHGALPLFNGTYMVTGCSNCSVINISALLTANGGLLAKVPESCNLSISGNDNCGGNADLGCSNKGSYIWLVDTQGNVFSYCAGAGCTTNNSGYQDVWP